MKRMRCLLLASVFPISSFASEGGIKEFNYNFGLSGSKADYGNFTSIGGDIRIPTTKYVGLTMGASSSKFEGKDNYIDSRSNSIGVGVLLRKSDLGSIGANYVRTSSSLDLPSGVSSISDKNSINNYSVNGAYYLNNIDVSVSRTVARSDDNDSRQSWMIGGVYYAGENMSISISGAGMDAKDNYFVFASYQPELLKYTTGVSFGYQNSEEDDVYSISIQYHFGTKVSLKNRARSY